MPFQPTIPDGIYGSFREVAICSADVRGYLCWCEVVVPCLPSEMGPELWGLQALCQLCRVTVDGEGGGEREARKRGGGGRR